MEAQKPWIEGHQRAKATGHPISFEFQGHFVRYGWACMIPCTDNMSCIIVKDISETKCLQYELQRNAVSLEETVKERTAELRQALETKSRFLAIMSHGKTEGLFFSKLVFFRNSNSIVWSDGILGFIGSNKVNR